MKWSTLNYTLQISNDEAIVYNSYSGKAILTGKNGLDRISMNLTIKQRLHQWGFLLEDSESEEAKFLCMRDELLNDNVLSICIIPTYQCNLHCNYCYQEHKNQVISEDKILIFVKWLQKNIGKYRGVHLSFFGGEPLLAYSEILDIVMRISLICNKANVRFDFSIITNGIELDVGRYDKLSQLGCKKIQITLDGSKSAHDKHRIFLNGNGSYEKIIYNIDQIVKCGYRDGSKLVLRVNVSNLNINDLYGLIVEKINNYKDNRISFYYYPISEWSENSRYNEAYLNKTDIEWLIRRQLEINPEIFAYYNLIEDILPGCNVCFGFYKNSFVLQPDLSLSKCTVCIEKMKYAEVSDMGLVYVYNYFSPPTSFKEECLDCPIIGTCFGLQCLQNNKCSIIDIKSFIDNRIHIMYCKGMYIDWRHLYE